MHLNSKLKWILLFKCIYLFINNGTKAKFEILTFLFININEFSYVYSPLPSLIMTIFFHPAFFLYFFACKNKLSVRLFIYQFSCRPNEYPAETNHTRRKYINPAWILFSHKIWDLLDYDSFSEFLLLLRFCSRFIISSNYIYIYFGEYEFNSYRIMSAMLGIS